MLRSFHHEVERKAHEPRHFFGARRMGGSLERVQFLRIRVSHQVAVFHALNVGPQQRDYKR